MKCVSSMCISEVHFEVQVFLKCLMHHELFWKAWLPDWCCVIFLHLLYSFCFCSIAHHPSPLSSSPATRLWRSGCRRCGGRGEKQSNWGSSVSHLAATAAASSDMMWRHSFQGNQGVDHAEKMVDLEVKKNNMPFRFFFFYWQLSKCHSAVVVLGRWMLSARWSIRQAKQFFNWHENNHLQPGTKWKCPSVLSPRFQAAEMNLLMYLLDSVAVLGTVSQTSWLFTCRSCWIIMLNGHGSRSVDYYHFWLKHHWKNYRDCHYLLYIFSRNDWLFTMFVFSFL